MKKGVQIFDLSGKVALITGACGHLGVSISNILAEAGAHVLINSRSLDKSKELVSSLLLQGYSAESAVFDITNESAIVDYFQSRGQKPLDILINNAYQGGSGGVQLSTSEHYVDSYTICVVGVQNIFKASLPALKLNAGRGGDVSVINIASMYGMVSPDLRVYDSLAEANPPYYGAAKAALLQWTRYAACEFGIAGIRINAISPGPFPSKNAQLKSADFVERLKAKVPLGRIGKADEIKSAILFLASPASTFVNGANIVVDGGWTCW